MIRDDPVKKAFRRLYLSAGIMALGVIILISFLYFVRPPGYPIDPFPIVVILIVPLLLLSASLALLRYFLNRIEKRRTRALREDRPVLAAEQPAPDEMALPEPTTFQFGLSRSYFLFLASGMIVGGIIVLLAFRIALTTSMALLGGWLVFNILAGVVLVVMLLMLVFLYFSLKSRMNCQVYVDQWGITTTFNKRTTHVDWHSARLFALNTVKKPRRPKIYELASSETVVRWFWIPRDVFFLYPLRPAVSQEQHDHQTRALLAYVAAKTHLPLCDIGEPVARWYM